jgi:hypothetical protein
MVAGNANPKLLLELPPGPVYLRNSFEPLFFFQVRIVFILTSNFVPSFNENWDPIAPVLDT